MGSGAGYRRPRPQPGRRGATRYLRLAVVITLAFTLIGWPGTAETPTPRAHAEGNPGNACNTLWYSTGGLTPGSSGDHLAGELGTIENPGPAATTTARHTIGSQHVAAQPEAGSAQETVSPEQESPTPSQQTDPPQETVTPDQRWRGSAASAVSTTNSEWVYFIPQTDSGSTGSGMVYGGLWAYHRSTGEVRELIGDSPATRSHRMGVAPDGSVWTVNLDGGLHQFTPDSTTNPTGGSWTARGPVRGASLDATSGDLAFDGSGTMWLIGANHDRAASLYTLGWADLTDGGGAETTMIGALGQGEFTGIAFTADGRLWATGTTSATGTLYLVDTSDGTASPQRTFPGMSLEGMGSCARPAAKVQVTNSVERVDPGPDAQEPSAQQLGYTVVVENTGTVAATGVTLQHELPRGVTYVPGSTRLNGAPVPDTDRSPGFAYATAELVRSAGLPQSSNGIIAPKQAATITFRVEVSPDQAEVCAQGRAAYLGGPGEGLKSDDPDVDGPQNPTCLRLIEPQLEVDIHSEVTELTENPQSAKFRYRVTNPGEEDLRDLALSDGKCSNITPELTPGTEFIVGDSNQDGLLNAEATGDDTGQAEIWKYSCAATLTEASFTDGKHVSTATASAVGVVSGATITDTAPWTITLPTPEISLEKTGDAVARSDSRLDVTYTYLVEPTGSEEPLDEVTVTDEHCAPPGGTPGSTPVSYVSGDTNNDDVLDLDEKWEFTCTRTVNRAEATESQTGVATTQARGAGSKQAVTAEDAFTVQAPMKTIDKVSSRTDGTPITEDTPLMVGEEILYTITVTNNGDAPLENLVLTDQLPTGTSYVPNSTTRLYWRTSQETVTKNGTFDTGDLPDFDFEWFAVGRQTFTTVGRIPADAQLTGYRATLNGLTRDDPRRRLGLCGGFLNPCFPALREDVSVAASLPGGRAWFEVDRSVDNNSFGTGPGVWNTVIREGAASGSAVGVYTLSWYDARDEPVFPDNTAYTRVVLNYTYREVEGVRRQVSDKLGQPANFIRAAEGISLEPGESAVVTFRVTVNDDHPLRIVNTAVADTDQTSPIQDSTNDPTYREPEFAVAKSAAGGEAGGTGARVEAVWDADTETFTAIANYTVNVTNTGEVVGPHPAINDFVTLPEGFTIDRVTLNGTPVDVTDGRFTIPAGTAPVAVGGTTSYQVSVIGRSTPEQWAAIDWQQAGTCNTAGAGAPTEGGFFNQVQIDSDSDGIDNNDACVPVDPPTFSMAVEKLGGQGCDVGQDACPVEGASFDLYDTDPNQAGATPIATLTVDPNQGWRHNAADLDLGEYWLVETKSPTGHELLAEPIAFSLTPAGVTLNGGTSEGVRLKDGDTFTVEVVDTTTGDLPMSGGDGVWPYWIVALLLIGAGVVWHRATTPTTENR
ncbi:SpaA isopeptide-forming pilin-related protein [Enemella sp. A6]|uniref:SpaA isopeptide-forming pilin-related protein n=1 Tax=Enemella sp. A6 TaxID=3440152 RepID=UPI003EBE2EEC